MSPRLDTLAALTDVVMTAPRKADRRLVALAGAPGSGKSTLADHLAQAMTQRGCHAQVVPMDGFHLDNRILSGLDLLARKGAPDTFDVKGFARLAAALGAGMPVYYPLFDRARDIAIAGAGCLQDECDTVIVEGNYLLLDARHWRDLTPFWDLTVRLDVPLSVLRQRLVGRWLKEGLPQKVAVARAEGNDLKNAQAIAGQALPCDVIFDGQASYV